MASCSRAVRVLSRSTFRPSLNRVARRCMATDAAPAVAATSSDPKLNSIVNDISGLTLLQAADLVTLLKTRLNITEIAMPSAAPAAAPAAASEEEVVEKPKEKTVFNVKLESFEATAKPKIIREVKSLIPGLTLIDAKKFVESLPKALKENIPKDEAEKLQKAFQALGAVASLE
ncbi:ClpS-like protein [Cylindrobasidium torrendii FP15055 ss-10]|uniref:ClpS-like protein n=1 Tax=Cylindrobasidium torrendii FP15055 ss-10 TaxID=1314674 RepID=A0A0D7AZ31_9AGAR|nr:ClpS-like protein [Cylindrobasidium torrendii FP15055 ss-10]